MIGFLEGQSHRVCWGRRGKVAVAQGPGSTLHVLSRQDGTSASPATTPRPSLLISQFRQDEQPRMEKDLLLMSLS